MTHRMSNQGIEIYKILTNYRGSMGFFQNQSFDCNGTIIVLGARVYIVGKAPKPLAKLTSIHDINGIQLNNKLTGHAKRQNDEISHLTRSFNAMLERLNVFPLDNQSVCSQCCSWN